MKSLVIFVEEESMEIFIRELIKQQQVTINPKIIKSRGKQGLLRRLPETLRYWNTPDTSFLVIVDSDEEDCIKLKQRIISDSPEDKRDRLTVRIVCKELEAWYFGDCEALATAYNDERLSNLSQKQSYRNADEITKPSERLAKEVRGFSKLDAPRKIARSLRPERNTSRSFQVFYQTLTTFAE